MGELPSIKITTSEQGQTIDFPELFGFLSVNHSPNYYSSSEEMEEDMAQILGKGGLLVWAEDGQGALVGFVSVFPEAAPNQDGFLVMNNLTSTVGELPFLAELIKKAIVPYLDQCRQIVFSINPDHSDGERRRFLIYQRMGFRIDPRFINEDDPQRRCLSISLGEMMEKLSRFTEGGE